MGRPPNRGVKKRIFKKFEERLYKITAAVVPARSIPFEIETLDLTAPLADEVLVRVVASDSMCHTDLHARDGYFPHLPYPAGSDCNGSCPSRCNGR